MRFYASERPLHSALRLNWPVPPFSLFSSQFNSWDFGSSQGSDNFRNADSFSRLLSLVTFFLTSALFRANLILRILTSVISILKFQFNRVFTCKAYCREKCIFS